MGYLLYSSNEMFSSTNLIRQSKQIFDKLTAKDIEKAVILRDGKPSFIMLDFDYYEKIMADYNDLKEKSLNLKHIKQHTKEQTITQNTISNETPTLQNALENSTNTNHPIDKLEVELSDDFKDEHSAEIKEFWNK